MENNHSDNKARYYRRAMVVVVPLKDVYQPTGYSVTLQAMACGKPIVLSRIQGLWAPDLLRDGENCLLVPPGDRGSLATAISRLAADPELRIRLGRAARATAEQHFNLSAAASSLEELIHRGLAGKRDSRWPYSANSRITTPDD